MNKHFFYIREMVDLGLVGILHCSTSGMLMADIFTKPLQGHQFCKLCNLIMKLDPSSPYHLGNLGHGSVLKTNVKLNIGRTDASDTEENTHVSGRTTSVTKFRSYKHAHMNEGAT
jgi:hypothetical protein